MSSILQAGKTYDPSEVLTLLAANIVLTKMVKMKATPLQ